MKSTEVGNEDNQSYGVSCSGCFCLRPLSTRHVAVDVVKLQPISVSRDIPPQPPLKATNGLTAASSLVVYLNPFPKPPKRLNIVDNAPVNTQYITMLSKQHMQGELPLEHVSKLLNPYEQACFTMYRFNQALLPHVSVFRIPIKCHMSPGSNWFGSAALSGSLSHHVHQEIWIGLLLAAQNGSKFWLWIAKKESELLGETSYPSLEAFMNKYQRARVQQAEKQK